MDNNKIYLSHPDIDSMDLDVVSNAMISLSKLEKNNFISLNKINLNLLFMILLSRAKMTWNL